MSTQTFTLLVHGEAGSGKSWLGDTAPGPRLILDAEGRAKYLPTQAKVFWNVMHENPPAADGTWETCIANVPDFDTMEYVYRWLSSGQHGFKSVIVDSLMEIQKRYIDKIVGPHQLDQQDWGSVLRSLELLVRNYRDLVLSVGNPTDCVVFTVGSKDVNGKMRPLLQGQLANTLPYFVDTVGYLYTTMEENNQVTRNLLVQPTNNVVAKDGTGRMPGPIVQHPNVTQMFGLLNGFETQPAAQPAEAE